MSTTTTPRPLTARQAEIYEFMLDWQETKGKPPTFRQIGSRFGIKSPNGVRGHLMLMTRKGWLTSGETYEPHRYAAIRIDQPPPDLKACAAALNAAAYKGSTAWRADGDRVDDGEGRSYDLEDARAVASYIERSTNGGRA